MAKNKNKRIKNPGYISDDQNEIRRFIIILVVVIVCILLVYLFTRIFVSKDLFNKKEETARTTTPGQINYNMTLVGSMLKFPDDEYYVMIMDASVPESVYYTGLMNTYNRNTDALPLYLADLSNELNQKYLSDTANLTAKNIEDFRVSGPTLVKISKGKITNTYTTNEKMVEVLKYIPKTNEETE